MTVRRVLTIATGLTLLVLSLVAMLPMADASAKNGCASNGGAIVADSTDVGWHCQLLP